MWKPGDQEVSFSWIHGSYNLNDASEYQAVSMNTDAALRPPLRLASIDAYRGLVMLLMMAEVLSFCAVSQALPDSGFWKFLCYHQTHVEWVGCSLHDLIQPGFSFLVGVVLPFSIASRRARGATLGTMARHAIIRSLILIILGIAMRTVYTNHAREVIWQFDDTLAQIGLGYGVLFRTAFAGPVAGGLRWRLCCLVTGCSLPSTPARSGLRLHAGGSLKRVAGRTRA